MTILEVYPTTDRVDEALAAEAAPGPGGVGGVFVRRAATFRQVEQWLTRVGVGTRRRLSPIGRSVLLERLLKDADLPPFRAVAAKAGFRRAVEGFFRDLAVGNAGPVELQALAGRLGDALGARLDALATLLAGYRQRLDALGLSDPADALGAACQAIENGAPLPPELERFERLRIHDVIDWPPARLTVVRAVAAALDRRGGRVEVVLPRNARPELADVVDPAWQALETVSSGLELTARPLQLPAPERIALFDAANEEMESRELARRVRQLLDSGHPPSTVLVAARDMASLAPTLIREFQARDVPVRHRRGRPVLEATVTKVALELCRLCGPDIARERVCALVGSAVIDLRGIASDAPIPARIVEHLRMARVRDRTSEAGSDGFAALLERLAREYEGRADPESAAAVRRTAAAIAVLFNRLDAWPARAPARRHGRALLSLLEDLRVPNRLRRLTVSGAEATRQEEELQASALAHEQEAWQRLPEAVAEVSEAFEACGMADVELSRTEYAGWLESTLKTESVRPASARGVAVELVELADVAGRDVAHLFIAGAHEGRLPGPPEPDPLFTDDERWRMNQALGRAIFRVPPRGADRSPFPSRQLLHGLSFALAVEASRAVTLSRPRADARGRPLAPSPFLGLLEAGGRETIRFSALDERHRSTPGAEDRVRVESERASFFAAGAPSRYAGDARDQGARIASVLPGTRERPLSASAIEKAANCRFRYFAETVLGAAPPVDDSEDAGPRVAGQVAHLAAEAAVRSIVSAGLWRGAQADAAISVGLDAARRAVETAEQELVVGDAAVWAVSREKMFARLARMLALELERTEAEQMVPRELEVGFGRDGKFPALEIGNISIAGKIDRVDKGPVGALVVDYKSGSSDANTSKLKQDALLVTEFQLPLYVLAVRRLLGTGTGVDAAYVSLRDGARTKSLLAAAKADWSELEERLEAALVDLVSRMREGDFVPKPVSCHGCHARPICRIPRPEGI